MKEDKVKKQDILTPITEYYTYLFYNDTLSSKGLNVNVLVVFSIFTITYLPVEYYN